MSHRRPDGAESVCAQCGSASALNARFCAACGSTLDTVQSAPRSHIPTPPAALTSLPHAIDSQAVLPAGRGVRASSFLLDLAAMMSPALPLSVLGLVIGVPQVVHVVIPVAVCAVWLWMQVWQALTGKTFGKMMLGLRVVGRADNQLPGMRRTLVRSLLFVGTAGLAALPVMTEPAQRLGVHDRISGLQVVDVTNGPNPLGPRKTAALRRAANYGLNRVHSPIPASAPRRG